MYLADPQLFKNIIYNSFVWKENEIPIHCVYSIILLFYYTDKPF